MQQRRPFRTFLTATTISTLLAGACSQAWAEDDNQTEALALRKIMQDLSTNMQTITGAISREDWETVAAVALLIADHPQPPLAEKTRIMRFVGADAGNFKSHDQQTHLAAGALQQAAERGEGHAVIASFATLQNTCLACHQRFRKPFLAHFYGQR